MNIEVDIHIEINIGVIVRIPFQLNTALCVHNRWKPYGQQAAVAIGRGIIRKPN